MAAGFAGLFPGQLSEKAGMGEALARLPYVSDLFETISRRSGVDVGATFFGEGGENLHEDLPAQVGVFAVSLAALEVLEREHGRRPQAVAGYSLGTYAAFVAAGALPAAAALDVLLEAARLLDEERVEGAMGYVIGISRPALEEILRSVERDAALLSIGNENAAQQFVLTGASDPVGRALAAASPSALRAERLPIRWPMHSTLLRPVSERLARFVSGTPVAAPHRAVLYAPMLGREVASAEEAASVLGRQIAEPSRWADVLRAMDGQGWRRFAEVGPGDVLAKLLRWTIRGAESAVLEEPGGIAAFAAGASGAPPASGRGRESRS